MKRIKIKDLPEPTKISKEEMKKVLGGRISSSAFSLKSGFNTKAGFWGGGPWGG